MLDSIKTSLSGLNAASKQVNAGANNLANQGTVGALSPEDGPPAYQPVDVVQTTDNTGAVRAETVARNPASYAAYDPNSTFANDEGLVAAPNVDAATEIVNMKLAEVAYKASLAALRTAQDMSEELLSRFDRKV